jgi:hypothetical protein
MTTAAQALLANIIAERPDLRKALEQYQERAEVFDALASEPLPPMEYHTASGTAGYPWPPPDVQVTPRQDWTGVPLPVAVPRVPGADLAVTYELETTVSAEREDPGCPLAVNVNGVLTQWEPPVPCIAHTVVPASHLALADRIYAEGREIQRKAAEADAEAFAELVAPL